MNKLLLFLSFLGIASLPNSFLRAQTSLDPTPYCVTTYTQGPASSCSVNDHINNFTFNTISNLNSGCTAGTPGDYIRYLPIGNKTTTVFQGLTYTMTIQGNAGKPNGYAVWIDYNNNDLLYYCYSRKW
jgi:hypothetical protein